MVWYIILLPLIILGYIVGLLLWLAWLILKICIALIIVGITGVWIL